MRCFNHPDRESIGCCKACYKGLCSECAVDLEHGLACRTKHEQSVEALHKIALRATRTEASTRRAKYAGAAFTALMGVMFVGYGYLREGLGGFISLLGAAFLVNSLVVFLANRRAYGQSNSEG
jgi:hypothetical protein